MHNAMVVCMRKNGISGSIRNYASSVRVVKQYKISEFTCGRIFIFAVYDKQNSHSGQFFIEIIIIIFLQLKSKINMGHLKPKMFVI